VIHAVLGSFHEKPEGLKIFGNFFLEIRVPVQQGASISCAEIIFTKSSQRQFCQAKVFLTNEKYN